MIVDCVKGVVKVGADVMEGVGDGLLVVERAGVGVLGVNGCGWCGVFDWSSRAAVGGCGGRCCGRC